MLSTSDVIFYQDIVRHSIPKYQTLGTNYRKV